MVNAKVLVDQYSRGLIEPENLSSSELNDMLEYLNKELENGNSNLKLVYSNPQK